MASEKLPWGLKSEGISPGAMKSFKDKQKNISESKLKAFNIGSMNLPKKGMTKKEQEEMKKKQEQEAAAQVYEEFVAAFQEPAKGSRTWVKGGVVQAGKGSTDASAQEKSRLYKPTSKLAELASTFQSVKDAQKKNRNDSEEERPMSLKKKKEAEKKKTNLELFKEELKMIQEERQERHKIKKQLRDMAVDQGLPPASVSHLEPPEVSPFGRPSNIFGDEKNFMYDNDRETTNLYLGNLHPNMSEQQLCELFGRYGPLASVKIMWPRSDEERSRGRNCGFVAFMNRKDGERCLNALKGKEIMGFEMKLGWGKAVPIPPHPVYIPPSLAELTLPPPPSGLPFNAQPKKRPANSNQNPAAKYGAAIPPPGVNMPREPLLPTPPTNPEEMDKTLANAVVKVVIPTERNLLCVIHRMIEFVVREGPMFEAMVMNRELSNPMFRFLFENQSPAHVYYRWKLFSILQGDSPHKWSTEKFRMFKGGSFWKPPPVNTYTQGMPEELVQEMGDQPKRGQLTDSQRDRLEDMLRDLTPERWKIGDAMVWCLEHAESAEEVVECITEALSILQTPIPKKIARLFLVSDILHNCSAKVPNASFYRKYFESKLPEIFRDVHDSYDNIDGRLKAEQFKQKVMACFRAWEDWAVYPNDFLIKLQNIFLGLVPLDKDDMAESKEEELDGAPLPDLDGAPIDLDGAPLPEARGDYEGVPYSDDLDGMPLDKSGEDIDGRPLDFEQAPSPPKFVKSKWEEVDEEEVRAQAVTTSKWDMFDPVDEEDQEKQGEEEDIDGKPLEEDDKSNDDSDDDMSTGGDTVQDAPKLEMTEERRAKLREIELKVMKYQDELESGRRSRKPNMDIQSQIQHYRNKLLTKEREKEEDRLRDIEREKRREEERIRVKEWERAREREKERMKEKEKRSRSSSSESEGSYSRDKKRGRSRSVSPPAAYRDLSKRSYSRSPNRKVKRPASPPKRHRSRSRSPSGSSSSNKKKMRSRSGSRSPSRSKHKHKKSKR
ncbi:U2 snRNP-associated SURP motif-containing protein isoform X1 [Lingula anatina]|uniref:U2 snRNP-associated SURP motif-containing protein isoform X1 n=2 Tax=Lingula anatina TaxID=7574 RepID=A0A1S3I7L7_LINAN|nr:U2 snRNP-associated SURP motif-containing protein isoform X1 [Lingula anatina]|eukprot:XP_013393846.1 U2 snRNP-associated SURP motif-containing protein isoform X1 [Lingula anatina]